MKKNWGSIRDEIKIRFFESDKYILFFQKAVLQLDNFITNYDSDSIKLTYESIVISFQLIELESKRYQVYFIINVFFLIYNTILY